MAGKSRRVASRQGELGRRRKRTQRGPSGIPVAAAARPAAATGGAAATAEAIAAGGVSANSAPAASVAGPTAAAPGAAAPSRRPGRARGERPAAYNYVGAELRRIGILSGVVLAALIGLAFVL